VSNKKPEICNVSPYVTMLRMIAEIDLDDKNTENWHRACAECGFFFLHNHKIDLTLIESAMDLSEVFFGLSKSKKNKIRRAANNCWGYYDEESSGLEANTRQRPRRRNRSFGGRANPVASIGGIRVNIYGPNRRTPPSGACGY
jgi:hypothetical protein